MSKVAIQGNASGTGTLTVAAPNTNSDYTLTLPAETGTVLTSGGAIDVSASAPADSVVINSSGNVGINTASPQDNTHITGIARIQSTSGSACYWRYDNTVNSGGKIWRWGDGITAHGTFSLYNQTDNAFVLNVTSNGNLQFNSGYGSAATAYGCRAWVNFNGTGTVAIRASGNVSSITDNGTGDYTINFTNAMPDANYSFGFGFDDDGFNDASAYTAKGLTWDVGSLRIRTSYTNSSSTGFSDFGITTLQIFR